MLIDVSKALSNPGQSIPFSADVPVESLTIGTDEVSFPSVRVDGTYTGAGDEVELDARVQARAKSLCARCLADAECELAFRVRETFTREVKADGDVYPLDGSRMDIAPMVREALILELPMRFLCDENCKGLCPQCGANLNAGPCGCRTSASGPFAALKELLKADEEV